MRHALRRMCRSRQKPRSASRAADDIAARSVDSTTRRLGDRGYRRTVRRQGLNGDTFRLNLLLAVIKDDAQPGLKAIQYLMDNELVLASYGAQSYATDRHQSSVGFVTPAMHRHAYGCLSSIHGLTPSRRHRGQSPHALAIAHAACSLAACAGRRRPNSSTSSSTSGTVIRPQQPRPARGKDPDR